MCGVFGFVSYDGQGPNMKTLARIAEVTMERGPHAFGFAWLDWSGRLKMFKRTGRIVNHLGLLEMMGDARILVGHCRWATHGDPKNNLNNHPHPADGGWIVHNGVVNNHEELAAEYDLHPVTACDSEVLGLLVAASQGTLQTRCAAVANVARGNLTLLGVWRNPARLVAVRAGNPLSLGMIRGGERYYLASLPDELPGVVSEVPNRTGLEFRTNTVTAFDVAGEPSVAGK
jgi:glucosamine--fructose-6-phosphate aminotransferase (isomerizing)